MSLLEQYVPIHCQRCIDKIAEGFKTQRIRYIEEHPDRILCIPCRTGHYPHEVSHPLGSEDR